MQFIAQLINGLSIGSIYALVALGYTMVYGIAKLINFAHGDIIMVGAYTALISMVTMGMPFWAAVVIAILLCALIGILSDRIAYKPLRNSPRISALITAIGISLLLENVFQIMFSPNPRPFPNPFSNIPPIIIGDVRIDFITVLTIAVSLILMVLLMIFVHKTKIGKAMRAVSEDVGAAELMGINSNTTISITFAVGSALAAVAAVLYCIAYPQVEPYMGSMLGLKAFIAAVLGGIGVIPGAMLGGLIMGVAESLTKGYISSQLSDAVVFGILIIVLLFKPSGLLGKHIREKV